MHGNGNTAEVVSVRHNEERHKAYGHMLQGMDGTHEMVKIVLHPVADFIGNNEPESFCFKDLGRHFEGHDVHELHGAVQAALIAGNLVSDPEPAEAHRHVEDTAFRVDAENFRGLARAHVGVPLYFPGHGVSYPLSHIEL